MHLPGCRVMLSGCNWHTQPITVGTRSERAPKPCNPSLALCHAKQARCKHTRTPWLNEVLVPARHLSSRTLSPNSRQVPC